MADKPSSTMPWWMKLVFLIFIGYMLYVGNFTSGTAPVATPLATQALPENTPAIPTPQAPASNAETYSELRNFLDADRWRRAMNPEYVGAARVKELQRGSGSVAGCGSEVSVRFRGTLSNGANFDPSHDERAAQRFILGQAPIAAMNEGVVGMQVGGVRQLSASPKQVMINPPSSLDSVLFRIEMDETSPASDGESQPFALMQVAAAASTALPEARCGEPMTAELVWFDAKGVIMSRETQTWSLGDRSIALGVDRAAHGMRLGESRFAVLPPLWHARGAYVHSVLLTRLEAEAKK